MGEILTILPFQNTLSTFKAWSVKPESWDSHWD